MCAGRSNVPPSNFPTDGRGRGRQHGCCRFVHVGEQPFTTWVAITACHVVSRGWPLLFHVADARDAIARTCWIRSLSGRVTTS